jgi:Cytochrome c552
MHLGSRLARQSAALVFFKEGVTHEPPQGEEVVGLLGVLVVLGAAFGTFVSFGPPKLFAKSETPEFCASCHVMQAEYDAWFYQGAHRRIKVIFMGAENSIGFHNPSEAGRICGDAVAMAMKADALLRQALARAGVDVPANVNLELAKYLNDRGVKKLKFNPAFEYEDPFGTQEMLTPTASLGK